ncbi:MAG TPA: glycosyltransferase, partial [Vicinamibacterales bacterium]|nr:glycosyltransferase [Vicinamibacterales bacterium]
LLSEITAPTSGEIRLYSRLSALIEVGSGFHPELTGRENVFLSGSIFGMRRAEIVAKLDQIIDFAGVGDFIDAPVKWYSSGMYVRLGFAIAAHLDPQILLVDEALAVGDEAFQAKCYDRIAALRTAGKTIIFISHDLQSVERVCNRALIMRDGRVAFDGTAAAAVSAYRRQVASETADVDSAAADNPPNVRTSPALVSVVIPCFNQARFLQGTLRSVVAQEWPSLESIVVDDGSTDDTHAVAAALGATTVVRQANRGLSRARNAGLAAARGEYVLFLDADDELLPDAIRSGVAALERHHGAGVVGRRCLLMDGEGHPLPVTPPVLASSDLYAELLGTNFIWTPGAALFRRDAIESIGGFPVHHPAAADYAVLLAMARGGRLIIEPRDVVRYRKHDSNMSRDARLMLRATLGALQHERPHMPPQYLGALAAGRRRWRGFYGEQLTTDLRREWRASRRPSTLLGGALFLFRHCPRQTAAHVLRKLTRVARNLPPAELEAPR